MLLASLSLSLSLSPSSSFQLQFEEEWQIVFLWANDGLNAHRNFDLHAQLSSGCEIRYNNDCALDFVTFQEVREGSCIP